MPQASQATTIDKARLWQAPKHTFSNIGQSFLPCLPTSPDWPLNKGGRLSSWRALLSISIRICGHKVTNCPPCLWLCNPRAERAEHIQRAEPVGRAFIINTFSLFSITFHNFSWKKFSSIISIGWNFEMGTGGRGGRGGRRGFWTRPRAAGESMEEVIYMRTDRRPS